MVPTRKAPRAGTTVFRKRLKRVDLESLSALFSVVFNTALAYVLATAVFQAGRLLGAA